MEDFDLIRPQVSILYFHLCARIKMRIRTESPWSTESMLKLRASVRAIE